MLKASVISRLKYRPLVNEDGQTMCSLTCTDITFTLSSKSSGKSLVSFSSTGYDNYKSAALRLIGRIIGNEPRIY